MAENTREAPHGEAPDSGNDSGDAEHSSDRVSHTLLVAALVIMIGVLVVGVFLVRQITTPQPASTIAESLILDLEQQIAADPANIDLRLRLADAYYRAKNYEEALVVLDELASEEVTGTARAMVLYGTGRIEQDRGNDDLALEAYMASLETKDLADTRYAIATLYLSREEWDDAITHFLAYMESNPTDGGALLQLGKAYEGAGDKAAALQAYEQALQFLPDDAEAVAAVARLKEQ